MSLPGDAQDEGEARELARLGHATSGLAPSTAHRVDLLVDGAATYDALLEAVRAARDHVHLEYYIYAPDRSGSEKAAEIEKGVRADCESLGLEVRPGKYEVY